MKTNMTIFLPLALAMALGQDGCDAADRTAGARLTRPVSETGHEPEENMKISVKYQDKRVTATLIDNETTRA